MGNVQDRKNICSLGAFFDSDMTVFCLSYNTEERLIKSVDPKVEKWWIPEWIEDDGLFIDDLRMKELDKTISELKEKTGWSYENYETFVMYKEEIFDLICESFKEIKEKRVLTEINDDFYMLVQESDNGVYGKRQDSLAKILSEVQLKEYLEFCEYWG